MAVGEADAELVPCIVLCVVEVLPAWLLLLLVGEIVYSFVDLQQCGSSSIFICGKLMEK